MARDRDMPDADAVEEETMMYGHGALTEEEFDKKYPHRPHNIHKTLPFHTLFISLFNKLNEQRKQPNSVVARKKIGPHGPKNLSPQDAKKQIIDNFIARWKKEVGLDIYPAFRLIVPEKDRDRAMYGLKEKTIGKLLVKVIGIDKNSEDAYNLINWKLPGFRAAATAGDFAARCFEVLQKRPMLARPGNMSIAEVNAKLDALSAMSKESEQQVLFEEFYRRMNPEELMWLIRITLRQMKIGATEKTFFERWHPDAEALFNVSSSLRRVCWELYDPEIRLESDKSNVCLMQCFQPQLANFQNGTFEKMVARLQAGAPDGDDEFWIEEKLDGERMQLHMVEDSSVPGGKRFAFWSRKGKEYTYLYGSGFYDENASLTRHLKEAFNDNVRNIILDGEMITWDMDEDSIVGFGTLKTAALSEGANPYKTTGHRPLFKVFDCLYLNDLPITKYTMRDRRKALESAIKPVHRRMELHEYAVATKASEIEARLRDVIANSYEGLVLKNPRSAYRLSERNDDWWKVKPEYMSEFGEALDCVIIGGYYGSGHRGGMLSSFLCGLRVDEGMRAALGIEKEEQCWSFFKVGGGMSASDYKEIREATEGKWQKWDPRNPPSDYISLAGGERQHERPDMWIKASESIVVEVKAASVAKTDQYRTGYTLRFPRFKRIRRDKSWEEALTVMEFNVLKNDVEKKHRDNEFKVDDERKKRRAAAAAVGGRRKKKQIRVQGGEQEIVNAYAGPDTKVFSGLTFFIISGSDKPHKHTKQELEQLVKANGGNIVQTQNISEGGKVICISDKKLVKVISIEKAGELSVIRPQWLFDCVEQAKRDVGGRQRFLLPLENDRHMLVTAEKDREIVGEGADEWGDSYARDVGVEELKLIFGRMPVRTKETGFNKEKVVEQLEERGVVFEEGRGNLFGRVVAYFDVDDLEDEDVEMINGHSQGHVPLKAADLDIELVKQKFLFGGGKLAERELQDVDLTHIIVTRVDKARVAKLRSAVAIKYPVPRIVTMEWALESWREKTLLDEERFVPS